MINSGLYICQEAVFSGIIFMNPLFLFLAPASLPPISSPCHATVHFYVTAPFYLLILHFLLNFSIVLLLFY